MILATLLLATLPATGIELSYTLTVPQPGTKKVEISGSLILPKERRFSLVIGQGQMYPFQKFGEYVEDLEAVVDGERLRPVRISQDAWQIPTGKRCDFSYKVRLEHLSGAYQQSLSEIPYSGPDFLTFPTIGLFLRPSEDVRPVKSVRIRYKMPDGWKVATNMHVQPDGRYEARNPGAFGQYSFVALGRFAEASLDLGPTKVRAILCGDSYGFPKQSFGEVAGKAVKGVHDFFGSLPETELLLIAAPYPGSKDRAGVSFGGSVSRSEGMSMMLSVDEKMGPKELNTQVGPLIVHETFHLGNPSSNVPDTWFREGFTTYYQHVIAARLGFLTEDEFVTELCQRSQNHRRVPPVSLEEAGKRMFQDRRCYEDVYTGGALMAFLLDVEMRRRGFSLDEVMLRLYRDYALRGKDFDRAVMGRIVTKISGVNLAEMIDQYVEHDQWPSIESTVRESGYTVEVKTEPYQLGVPLKSVGDDGYKVSSIPSGIDTGLKEGDVIVAVDGKSVHNRDLLMAALKGDPAGDQFQLTIKRGDAMMNIAVTPYRITKVTAHKKEGGDTSVIDAIVSAAHSQ